MIRDVLCIEKGPPYDQMSRTIPSLVFQFEYVVIGPHFKLCSLIPSTIIKIDEPFVRINVVSLATLVSVSFYPLDHFHSWDSDIT